MRVGGACIGQAVRRFSVIHIVGEGLAGALSGYFVEACLRFGCYFLDVS